MGDSNICKEHFSGRCQDCRESLAYIEALETQLAEAGNQLRWTARRLPPLWERQVNAWADKLCGPDTPTCRICGHTTDSKIHEWCERKEPTP